MGLQTEYNIIDIIIPFHVHFSKLLWRKKCAFYSQHIMYLCNGSNFILKNKVFHQSVQFSHSVMSDSLWPHKLQHARPPCPSPAPGVYSSSCPLSRWCHPAISSSVVPFSSCTHSLPASGSFFQWVNSSHEVAKVLEFQLQHQSFQWTPRTEPL